MGIGGLNLDQQRIENQLLLGQQGNDLTQQQIDAGGSIDASNIDYGTTTTDATNEAGDPICTYIKTTGSVATAAKVT